LPAILLASALTNIPLGQIIAHQFIFSLAALAIGILILLTGKAYSIPASENSLTEAGILPEEAFSVQGRRSSILLAAGPILANVFLVIFLKMNTSLAMGLVLLAMILILKLNAGQIKRMLITSLDYRIQWGVISILFFQSILNTTGTMDEIIAFFQNSGIPSAAVICLVAFFVGLSTAIDQSFVAVAFPLIGPLSGGNLDVLSMAYLCGVAGMMLSPIHLCLLVSLEYFKADFFKSLMPVILMELLLVTFGFCYLYFI